MKRFVFLALLVVYFTSCTKSAKTVPTYNLPIPQDAFDFANFKVGSYWIYQDSISHVLDSVYVIDATQGVRSVDGTSAQNNGFGGNFGYFTCDMYSSYEGVRYWNSVDRESPINQTTTAIVRTKWRLNSQAGQGDYLVIPYPLNKIIYESQYLLNDSMVIVRDNASYTLNSTILSNVLEIHHAHNPLCNKLHTKTFVKKGYGILRREIPDSNRVWNLVRCNLMQ